MDKKIDSDFSSINPPSVANNKKGIPITIEMVTPQLAAQIVKRYVLPLFKDSRIAARRGKSGGQRLPLNPVEENQEKPVIRNLNKVL